MRLKCVMSTVQPFAPPVSAASTFVVSLVVNTLEGALSSTIAGVRKCNEETIAELHVCSGRPCNVPSAQVFRCVKGVLNLTNGWRLRGPALAADSLADGTILRIKHLGGCSYFLWSESQFMICNLGADERTLTVQQATPAGGNCDGSAHFCSRLTELLVSLCSMIVAAWFRSSTCILSKLGGKVHAGEQGDLRHVFPSELFLFIFPPLRMFSYSFFRNIIIRVAQAHGGVFFFDDSTCTLCARGTSLSLLTKASVASFIDNSLSCASFLGGISFLEDLYSFASSPSRGKVSVTTSIHVLYRALIDVRTADSEAKNFATLAECKDQGLFSSFLRPGQSARQLSSTLKEWIRAKPFSLSVGMCELDSLGLDQARRHGGPHQASQRISRASGRRGEARQFGVSELHAAVVEATELASVAFAHLSISQALHQLAHEAHTFATMENFSDALAIRLPSGINAAADVGPFLLQTAGALYLQRLANASPCDLVIGVKRLRSFSVHVGE